MESGQVGWLEEAEDAAAVKATTTATRDKNQCRIPVEIKGLAMAAAIYRNLVLRKDLRKKTGRPEENLMPGWVRFPREKIVQRPIVKNCGSMDVPAKTERSGWRR